MLDKINGLWPEIVMLITAFTVMLTGLSSRQTIRRGTTLIGFVGIAIAIIFTLAPARPDCALCKFLSIPQASEIVNFPFITYIRLAVLGVGFFLLLAAAAVPDESCLEDSGKKFDPASSSRGEFFGFFLLSLTGVMLCASADDLIWLFMALELTSLPTYVMVIISRKKSVASEAGVKYFFLGAFAAAIFLYGFALIYGATGTTNLAQIQIEFARMMQAGQLTGLAVLGMVLALVGVSFKIAAVPMHAYTADVYQGAATPVTAFLAFVPKTAGFVTLIILLGTLGWPITAESQSIIFWLLWAMALATMFVGNCLALMQRNVKRVLAYSSIAHSGYMMIGLAAGTTAMAKGNGVIQNGLGAVLFYLVAYGVMNLGAFAVLGSLKAAGEDAETYDDIKGLVRRHPGLAVVMVLCVLSLMGFPPVLGFWGKVYLFGSAVSVATGPMYWLVIFGVLNSAIAAVYYLRIVGACFMGEPTIQTERVTCHARQFAAIASAIAVVVLSLTASPMMEAANSAAKSISEVGQESGKSVTASQNQKVTFKTQNIDRTPQYDRPPTN